MILVDSNVLLDILLDDPEWASWYAEHMAARLSRDWYASPAEEEAIWDA